MKVYVVLFVRKDLSFWFNIVLFFSCVLNCLLKMIFVIVMFYIRLNDFIKLYVFVVMLIFFFCSGVSVDGSVVVKMIVVFVEVKIWNLIYVFVFEFLLSNENNLILIVLKVNLIKCRGIYNFVFDMKNFVIFFRGMIVSVNGKKYIFVVNGFILSIFWKYMGRK